MALNSSISKGIEEIGLHLPAKPNKGCSRSVPPSLSMESQEDGIGRPQSQPTAQCRGATLCILHTSTDPSYIVSPCPRVQPSALLQTSCGAGLPVLSSLKALIESGDEVISIEGILSGTLSYIFNTWKAGEPFSSVVLSAKDLGYTEPDPREDLSGMDVARKVCIALSAIVAGCICH